MRGRGLVVISLATLAVAQPVLAAQSTTAPTSHDHPPGTVMDQLIVAYESGHRTAAAAAIVLRGGTVRYAIDEIDLLSAATPAGQGDRFIEELSALDVIRYVQHDRLVYATGVPNDPLWSEQWGPAAVAAPAGWDVTTGSHAVLVAVIDSGVDVGHPDLGANVCAMGWDYVDDDADPDDEYGHGTPVAGVIAAGLDNGKGIAGMANACLLVSRVLDNENGSENAVAFASDVMLATVDAVQAGARVINLSLGGAGGSLTCAAMTFAVANDAVVVASAGNNGLATLWPANCAEVISVGGLAEPGDEQWPFSSFGKIDVAAPAARILSSCIEECSTHPNVTCPMGNSEYCELAGTSLAAPHVSGLAALLRAANPSLAALQVRCLIELTADDLGTPGPDPFYGWGRINARRALESAASHEVCVQR